MRRFVPALAGLVCAVTAWAAPAAAYEIDPLTRQPLDQPLTVTVRSPAAAAAAVDPLDAAVPKLSPIPRETVAYAGPYGAGTIVVSTAERRLYYVLGNGQALRYGVGVGRPGFTWNGVQTISMKREWPDWRPPAQMIRRRPDLPRHMKGGPENPLGARAMYLGGSLYRIHGSNEPETIGTAVSSGCIRMTNDDVMDLYTRAKVGTKVIVQR
ncbi:ErfK/YbiS/YcfS/YnhG family protein [Methylobacterium indicum]|uniref:ErfK/YbiS/YcfS/YnhG family protein n=1 Tax=Methylobacterium indicum TaxID=1775910 RepID=A0A0J6RT97_9HYPH|nr:L,D-transpeptidase [Methylobacterium indicum]KMO12098.1 ErfK/YbiS/YcfS/YnhG family protein [Methylobacterium indicum]KMO26115.1 ErfK/YbiS/YcfS/YnhG family protein [Methylobacterium indicum]KTS25723.1 ErfK/YbiS/YcfS/YnhG family protein [Methylobacterium indicum]KTS39621.1 ErfK/YbiS/YcfS/YnhG family protein [Methylobacterium indicum]KTS51856.1 ErfK/YbiS/YcfS/YnhG family protein [Methylobacterium indicum]